MNSKLGLLLIVLSPSACVTAAETEVSEAELKPQWCTDDASAARASCESVCDAIPDPVGDCIAPANEQFQIWVGQLADAFSQIDYGPAVANVEECISSFDGLEDDCEMMRQKTLEGMAAYGETIAQLQAAWNSAPCEAIAAFMRQVQWKETSCILKHRDELIAEAGDTAVFGIVANQFVGKAQTWVASVVGCGIANFGLNAATWSCKQACGGAEAVAYAQCRNVCPGPAGGTCVPAGYPGWAACGQWQYVALDERELAGGCSCVAHDFDLNPWSKTKCDNYDDAEGSHFGTFNRDCNLASPSSFALPPEGATPGYYTLVPTYQAGQLSGGPSGQLGCFPKDYLNGLETSDSCSFAFDGLCEVGTRCADGTDTTDCTYGDGAYL